MFVNEAVMRGNRLGVFFAPSSRTFLRHLRTKRCPQGPLYHQGEMNLCSPRLLQQVRVDFELQFGLALGSKASPDRRSRLPHRRAEPLDAAAGFLQDGVGGRI